MSFQTSSSPTTLGVIIAVISNHLLTSRDFSLSLSHLFSSRGSFSLRLSSAFLFPPLLFLLRPSFPQLFFSLSHCHFMASSSSRKRRERIPSPSEGESFSKSTQGKVQEVVERPAFPLRDPWYTPSLFFPLVSHSEPPPSLIPGCFLANLDLPISPRFQILRKFWIYRLDEDLARQFPFSSTLSQGRLWVGLVR